REPMQRIATHVSGHPDEEPPRAPRRRMSAWRSTRWGAVLLVVAALLCGALVAGCGDDDDDSGGSSNASGSSTTEAPAEVRVGIILGDPTPSIIRAAGWLSDALPDTKVKWTPFNTGADVIKAIGTDQLDMGVIGNVALSTGLASGLEADLVYVNSAIT